MEVLTVCQFVILAWLKIQVENCILCLPSDWPIYGCYFISVVILDQLDLPYIKELLLAELAREVFDSISATLTTFLGVMTCLDLPLDVFTELVLLFTLSIVTLSFVTYSKSRNYYFTAL